MELTEASERRTAIVELRALNAASISRARIMKENGNRVPDLFDYLTSLSSVETLKADLKEAIRVTDMQIIALRKAPDANELFHVASTDEEIAEIILKRVRERRSLQRNTQAEAVANL